LAELRERLVPAGLREVDTDLDPSRDQYCLIAEAAPA
jgi:hypothetical protein